MRVPEAVTVSWSGIRSEVASVFSELYRLMGMMVLLMGAGFLMRKTGIITLEGKKCLTDIILYAILPCNIIKAFSREMEAGFWSTFFMVLLMAVLAQVVSFLLSRLLYRRFDAGEKCVYQYATVCSNSGFMGNPLAEGVFGETGLLYASIFLIPQRIVMWTAGVSSFQKTESGKTAYRKILTHPCMVATYIGMVIMVFQIPLPGVLGDTILAFSNCCTAMTMVYIGTILTDVDFRELFGKHQIFFAAIRLALIPALVYGICRLTGMDALITGVSTLLSATPAGSTTSLLAAKYGADEKAAARCVVFTTALSAVTIPVWSMFLLRM
ncbi:MAG TPA: AEC family transporter [Candidatus Eisenbergiella merdipullorum]|uniref:AEC family transporter n=1 Tax=Candidatus Eisenbergiella merdipullorum TaxID=2838553 RepID=A0A9D2L1N4_9FIRM|nr:AEC family transporter [Candidatus Eisenbergiella merdipullorum]